MPSDHDRRLSFAVACPNCKALRHQIFSLDDLGSLLNTDKPLYCPRCDYRWNADEELKTKVSGMLKQLDQHPEPAGHSESLYTSDSNGLRDELKGGTTQHADPPRLEDEGQSGG